MVRQVLGFGQSSRTVGLLSSLYAIVEKDETCQVRIKGLFCFAGNVY
jgi:hypothetical protein